MIKPLTCVLFLLALLHPSLSRQWTRQTNFLPGLNPQALSLSPGSQARDNSTLRNSWLLAGLLNSLHHWIVWVLNFLRDMHAFVWKFRRVHITGILFPLPLWLKLDPCFIRVRLAQDTLVGCSSISTVGCIDWIKTLGFCDSVAWVAVGRVFSSEIELH